MTSRTAPAFGGRLEDEPEPVPVPDWLPEAGALGGSLAVVEVVEPAEFVIATGAATL